MKRSILFCILILNISIVFACSMPEKRMEIALQVPKIVQLADKTSEFINEIPKTDQKVFQNKIKLVTRKNGRRNKVIAIFVYTDADAQKKYFEDSNNPTYLEFQNVIDYLNKSRLNQPQIAEKGNPIIAEENITPMKQAQQVVDETELELISYEYDKNDSKSPFFLGYFINKLLKEMNKNKFEILKFIVVAYGENCDVVSKATHQQAEINTLIYFQPWIYEPSEGCRVGMGTSVDSKPQNFERLYNFYSKPKSQETAESNTWGGWLKQTVQAGAKVVGAVTLERKYRQQAKQSSDNEMKIVMPVKNVRMIKEVGNTLEDYLDNDFFNSFAVKNYPALIDQIESYQVNFDLIARGLGGERPIGGDVTIECNEQEIKLSQEPKVAINRFVKLENGKLMAECGSETWLGSYVVLEEISSAELLNIKVQFSKEADRSRAQLIDIIGKPGLQGWWKLRIPGTLEVDIPKIQERNMQVITQNNLYEFVLPPEAERFESLITRYPQISSSFDEIAKIVPMPPKKFAYNQIKKGALYASYILNGNERFIPTQTQEDYLNSIIALIWFFYWDALEKNQAFEEGTFVIEDKNLQIYNFLMRYIEANDKVISGVIGGLSGPGAIMNQELIKTLKDPALHVTFNLFGYPRASTHYEWLQNKYRHYGIDIRFSKHGYELPLLPANKRHILFGIVNDIPLEGKTLIFIKPENYGLYYSGGLLSHASELCVSKVRKHYATEKSDDDEWYRKERVPTKPQKYKGGYTTKGFLKPFDEAVEEAVKSHKFEPEMGEELKNLARREGIKILYDEKFKNEYPKIGELDPKIINAIKKDIEALRYDHLEMRSGREIIITDEDLRNILNRAER